MSKEIIVIRKALIVYIISIMLLTAIIQSICYLTTGTILTLTLGGCG
jgi:hypothetical protein